MTDRIEPALTPKGWKHARSNPTLFAAITLEGGNDDDLTDAPWDWDPIDLHGDDEVARAEQEREGQEARRLAQIRGAIAALNDALPADDKRKITREWAEDIRHAAAEVALYHPQLDRLSAALTRHADALENYLPPK